LGFSRERGSNWREVGRNGPSCWQDGPVLGPAAAVVTSERWTGLGPRNCARDFREMGRWTRTFGFTIEKKNRWIYSIRLKQRHKTK